MATTQKSNELLTGSVARGLVRLALPVMAGMFLQTAFNLVDTWFVSKLGEDAIAAVGMNIPLFFIVLALSNAVAVGTSSLVAQAIGADNRPLAGKIASQALSLSLVLGAVTTAAGIPLTRAVMVSMGAKGLALEHAVVYTRIILAGNPFMFTYAALDGVLRGEGDMKTSTVVLGLATVLNIVLDPLLIFGLGPIPAMGVGGAALATSLARGLGLVILLVYFQRRRSGVPFRLWAWSWDLHRVIDIFRIGVPTAISQAMFSLTMFVYNWLANLYGSQVVAALGLGFRIDSLAVLPGMSVSIATVTMVGQNFGAGLRRRVVSAWRAALLMAFLVMEGLALIILAFPEFFAGIFTTETAVFTETVNYLRTVPIFYGFLGMGFVTTSAFQGLGQALPATLVNALRVGVIGIPAAFLLTRVFALGPQGIWWGLALSDFSFCLVGVAWFAIIARSLLQTETLVEN